MNFKGSLDKSENKLNSWRVYGDNVKQYYGNNVN